MNKNIKCIPFPEIENAYIIVSGHREEVNGNGIKNRISFFYNGGEIGAEWEPEHGSITVIFSCDKDHKDAKPHGFYDYCTGYENWSQLAVEDEMLPDAFLAGDYESIFNVLKDWSDR